MSPQVLEPTFQYSHTIGADATTGKGFRTPVSIALRGEQIYVVNRSQEYQPHGRRVTVCTVDEEFILEFGQGPTTPGEDRTTAADGCLIWPTSVALDKVGNAYVADEWLNRISIFGKDGEFKGKWGTPGMGVGEIDQPSGLCFDSDDNLLLVDSGNNRIQKFTKDGEFLSRWGTGGNGNGELNLPWGIDIDDAGDVYVVDWGNSRVQKFTANGQFLMAFGRSGKADGELNQPSDIAVDLDGLIYVADWDNDRVQVFDANGSFITKLTGNGTISKWGKERLDANPEMWRQRELAYDLEREKDFSGPISVAVDNKGRIFISESGRHRIQVYRKQVPIFFGGRL